MHRLAWNVARCRTGASRSTVLHGRYITSRQLTSSARAQAPKQPPEGSSSPNAAGSRLRGADTDLPPELDNIGIPPTNFAKPTLTALNFWYRFAKFSFIGIAVLVSGAFVGLEGTHYWIEHVELAPPSDPDGELEKWGWLKEAERWTGGKKGGTDPALSTKAKYALRAAWITEHWGAGAQIISANTLAHVQRSPEQAVEASLEYTHDFLSLALALAIENDKEGKPLRPETISEIMLKKAATLERIGSRGALYDARATYEHIWDTQARIGTDVGERARLALKLGDVNARLGDRNKARSWWARSLHLASSDHSPGSESTALHNTRLEVPSHLPTSPHAQRTIAATLSSLSAFYAQSGRLADARAVEDAGIALFAPSLSSTPSNGPSSSTMSSPQGAESNSDSDMGAVSQELLPPQRLHDLYLQHRVSLLALHRAEVGHALRSSPSSSSSSSSQTLEELAKAAVEAEDVIFALTSTQSQSASTSSSSSSSSSSEAPVHKATLDSMYEKDRTLKGPASSLLRDARRTALHAWTLSGILHENAAASSSSSSSTSSPSSSSSSKSSWQNLLPSSSSKPKPSSEADAERKAALRCYARALAWAGTARPGVEAEAQLQDAVPGPSRDMLESEWRTLWEGYTRTRDAVLASASAGGVEKDSKEEKERKV